jgi:hypothetical protein
MSDVIEPPVPDTLAVGLKEWSWCCQALMSGHLILCVRKGGIHERQGGLFTLDHRRFLLFPSHLHQSVDRLQPAMKRYCTPPSAPPEAGFMTLDAWAEATRVWKVTDLDRVLALGDELAWSPAELTARFSYRDQPWLYVFALRIHRLAVAQRIADVPRYAGCVSWVRLDDQVALRGSQEVLDAATFDARLERIAGVLDSAPMQDRMHPP